MGETKMVTTDAAKLKLRIKRKAFSLGIHMLGVAPVERWAQDPHQTPDFWPQNIWPWSRNVIVMGMQLFPSMIETTPSVVFSELYNTTNQLLDHTAYRIASFLNEEGYRAHFFPRDCYGDISALVKRPEAAFSHVLAALYAGLGTVGMNHTLLTKKYGSRIRWVSVITDAELPPDKLVKTELCIRCQACVRVCPMQAFTPIEGQIVAKMDKHKCALCHQNLKKEFHYPCGRCIAACPIGEDKKRYRGKAITPEGILHCQDFGAADAGQVKPKALSHTS